MFAPNDVCIAGEFKTERGIAGHGIGSGEQYQGHFIADDGLGALDQLLADTQALVLPVDGQVRGFSSVHGCKEIAHEKPLLPDNGAISGSVLRAGPGAS
jgi:hypothetical protein